MERQLPLILLNSLRILPKLQRIRKHKLGMHTLSIHYNGLDSWAAPVQSYIANSRITT